MIMEDRCTMYNIRRNSSCRHRTIRQNVDICRPSSTDSHTSRENTTDSLVDVGQAHNQLNDVPKFAGRRRTIVTCHEHDCSKNIHIHNSSSGQFNRGTRRPRHGFKFVISLTCSLLSWQLG